jgi:hypothetical protein
MEGCIPMSQPENPAIKGKYAPLYSHLTRLEEDEWRASFAEIEAVLGFSLPRSARTHQPWWSNQTNPGSHPHAQAWQRAGWKARNVNLIGETLSFQRVSRATPHFGRDSPVSVAKSSNVRPEATVQEETAAQGVSGVSAGSAATLFEQLARLNRGLTNVMDEGRRVLKRIIQSDDDLAHAAECAEQILQRDLHSATAREDKRLLRCLNTALIVSYVRPFSGNRGSPDVRKTLPAEYLDVLSDEQRQLHEQLIELRNRDHAHSDPQGRSASVGVQNFGDGVLAITLGRDAFAPLPRESVERVAELIVRLRAKLAEEQVRIQGTLKAGERF